MAPIIRSIEPQDLPQAYSLIEDLIRHENVGRPLQLTLESMDRALFHPNADWHGLVAAQNTELIGICFYSFANTSRLLNPTPLIYIDAFYIHSKYRKRGIGEQLFKELGKIAHESQIARIELCCLKHNNIGQNFYQKLGIEKLNHIDVFRFDVNKLIPEFKSQD